MKLIHIAPVALAAPQPPAHYQHTTQLLVEPEPDSNGAFLYKPTAGREIIPANEIQAEPFLHWGINE